MVMVVTNAFNISAGTATKGIFSTNTISSTTTIHGEGAHQLSFGAGRRLLEIRGESHARSGGNWTISGQITGASLATSSSGA